MAKACDLCERTFIPRGEIYFEVSIRVRPAGEVAPEVTTPPHGVALDLDADAGLGSALGATGCGELEAKFDDLAVDEFLAQALKTHRYTLCSSCRREFQADPVGKARRVPVR